jgi:hypothetical protein
MPQSKSVPTYINFAFDVPEPVSFSGNFVYNYFLKDERNSSNPWSDLSAVKRNTPRSDFNPLSPIPGIPARKNVLKFSSLNSITEIEESKNRYTEKQKLNFLNKNAEFILSEVEAQNERTVFISVQDKNSSKDIQSSLEAVLLHQRALERGLSPLEAVLKFNSITSDKISSQEILDTTDIEANSNLTYYDPVTKKDLSVQSLEGSLKTSLGGSYNKKFVADILKNAENSPFSPIWGNVESIISESEIIQNEAETSLDSNQVYMSDYEFPVTPIDVQEVQQGAFPNLVEVCGYIIEKYEMDGEGKFNFVKYFSISSIEKNELEDYEVFYGKTYKYRIKSVFLLSTIIASPTIEENQAYATYLFSSRGFVESEIICKEFVPPPPPNNIQFFLSEEKKLMIFWDMPFNKQEDIKRFQVFKRFSLEEPYALVAQIDFDDSEVLTKRSENVPNSKNIKKKFATTNYLDFNYEFEKSYYYAICSVDAHDLSSPYSSQFLVSYNGIEGKMDTKLIAFPGAPKPYPNFTIKETLLEDCIKDSGHSKMKIYFDPECLILYGPTKEQNKELAISSNTKRSQEKNYLETSGNFKGGSAVPMYKLQIINLDRQQDQKVDIYVKRSLDLNDKINKILPGD